MAIQPGRDFEGRVVELERVISVHEAVCEERYGKIVQGQDDMKRVVADLSTGLTGVLSKLTEQGGRRIASREVIAWIIAAAGILATLYSGLPFHGVAH